MWKGLSCPLPPISLSNGAEEGLPQENRALCHRGACGLCDSGDSAIVPRVFGECLIAALKCLEESLGIIPTKDRGRTDQAERAAGTKAQRLVQPWVHAK